MALGEAILVCLIEEPMSGYDLAKAFDKSIGFFWRASHQQIYRELGKLREKNLIESREIAQSGKPNRIVHTITDKGREAIYQWSVKPGRRASIKDDLLVKLYALGNVDKEALKEEMGNRRDHHRAQIKVHEKMKRRLLDRTPLTPADQGKLLAIELGLENDKMLSKWAAHVLKSLDKL